MVITADKYDVRYLQEFALVRFKSLLPVYGPSPGKKRKPYKSGQRYVPPETPNGLQAALEEM